MRDERESTPSRRQFLATAAAMGAPLLVSPRVVRGTDASSRLTLGFIGCGGRGTWMADLFRKHGGYEVRAAADYFQDKVDAFGDKLEVPADRRFTGLDGYRRILVLLRREGMEGEHETRCSDFDDRKLCK